MPGGYKKINGDDGKKFSSDYQPEKNGRKPSIRKQLSELLLTDGEYLVQSESVVDVREDGSVIIKVPTEIQLAMKLQKIATGNRPNEALKAIQMIMEQIDGKPKQETETTVKGEAVETWLSIFQKSN